MLLQTGFCYSLVFILIILNLITVSFDFHGINRRDET